MVTVIIGAGPAGRLAASELGKNNEKVILIEKRYIAGTCLNEGCMVISALNDIARFLKTSNRYNDLDIVHSNVTISYPKIVEKIKETQSKLRKIEEMENKKLGNEIIYGEAEVSIENNNIIVKVNNKEYIADSLLIATGARPYLPEIQGIENAITSSDILNLKNIPDKLNIIGGGMIAIEIANIFSTFGSEVHIHARSKILKNIDQEMVDYAKTYLLNDIHIHENVSIKRINKTNLETSVGNFEGITLVATGRVPNSQQFRNILDLNDDGSIKVNEKMETSYPNIYAAGDITGGVQLTPIARKEGIIAARNIMGGNYKMNYEMIPESLTLEMPLSFINNTKDDENIEELTLPGSAGPDVFWRLLNEKTGLSKIKLNKNTGELVDAMAISPSSVDDTAYIAFLMKLGMDKETFDNFIELHPSTDTYYKILKFL